MAYVIRTPPTLTIPRLYIVEPYGESGSAAPPPTEGQIWPRGEKATG